MRQAGKNALIGLAAITAIIASQQPWEAIYASQPGSQSGIQGQSLALAKSDSSALRLVDNLTIQPHISTFSDQHLLLESMQLPVEPEKPKNIFAAANTAKVEAINVTIEEPNEITPTVVVQSAIEEHHLDSTDYALNADMLFDMVNQHRASIGKPALQKDGRLMEIGQSRAPEVFDEIFVNGNMHAGFYARNLPYWATETVIHYHNEEGALNWWLHSPIHRPILEGDYQFAGIGCSGKDCSMIFSNFVAK